MKITLYSKTGCGWCKEVLDLFKDKKVSFEEREVLANDTYFAELIAKSGQTKAPTLDIDGVILADSDRDQVEKFLKENEHPAFQ